MNTIVSKKVLIRLGSIYGFILMFINFMGYIIVTTAKMPLQETRDVLIWMQFKADNKLFITNCMFIIFMIPIIAVILYIFKVDDEKLAGRIINLPVMFSIIGGLGWVIPYLYEIVCLLYVGWREQINMKSVAFASFLNTFQSALFIGTFAFMSIDAVHRKFVLPKYFTEGKLSQHVGTLRLSTRILITIFYLSVGLFPSLYMLSVLENYRLSVGFEVESITFHVMFGTVIFGIIMLFIFSNYFSVPLKKLRDATDGIKSEKYDEKVDVVSCDDFGALADNFNDMATELDWKTKRIIAIQESIIRGMAVMVESRDNSTGGHIARTSDCVKILVDRLKHEEKYSNVSDHFWKSIIKAAPMHDLGKIAIDDAILRKPGKFTDEEYEVMKIHAAEGAKIVENVLKDSDDIEFKDIAKNVAHYHHEKWNGSGYPEGISGEQIPLEARIMALADVFDALVSKRYYKDSYSFEKAFSIIEDSLGSHFDPELGRIFLKCRKELEELYTKE